MKIQILDHMKSSVLAKSTLISTTVFKHLKNLAKALFWQELASTESQADI